MFDKLQELFKNNYDELAPVFIQSKKPSALINKDNKQDVLNLHEAYINDLRNSFSTALGKDRLYLRPAGFIQE